MAHNQSLSSLFGFAPIDSRPVKINGREVVVQGEAVTGMYFGGLGVHSEVGRLLEAHDADPHSTPAIVLSSTLWAREFSKSPSVVGQALHFHHVAYTIVGVASRTFSGTEPGQSPDFWVPVEQWDETQLILSDSTSWGLAIMGRLRPDVRLPQAEAELAGLFQQTLTSPASGASRPDDLPKLMLTPGARGIDLVKKQFSRPTLGLVLTGSLVFVVSCANVALLMLNRAFARRRDLGLLVSLGVPRPSLIRRALAETTVLTILGAGIGLGLVYVISAPITSMMRSLEPFIGVQVSLEKTDLAVISFVTTLMALTAIACGVIPAWYVSGRSAATVLHEQGPFQVNSRKFQVREFLLVFQTASSVVLLIMAGLMIRTLQNLQHQNLGFNPQNVLLFSINPAKHGYKGASLVDVYRRLQDRLQNIPGAVAVSCSSDTLGSDSEFGMPVSISGHPEMSDGTRVLFDLVGADFLRTMEMPVLRGRDLTRDDMNGNAKPVAVINQAMAQHFFPGTESMGKTFGLSGMYTFEVVGLVGNVKGHNLRDDPTPRVYLPYKTMLVMLSTAKDGLFFEVRSSSESAITEPVIRNAVDEIDRSLPILNIETQMQQVSESVLPERVLAGLSTVFGLLVLLLTSISIYAIQSNSVIQRTHEIGIRLSMGSTRRSILWMILRRCLYVVVPGLAAGMALAFSLSRLFASQLYGVRAADLTTNAIAVLLILAISLLGSVVPAMRGAFMNPWVALRHE
jgi:predicted permease